MRLESSVHLSEEKMNDMLIGVSSAESEAHVAACAECRAQLDAFRADMRLFDQTSMAWSEARSATLGAIAAPKRHKTISTPLGLAFASALLLAIGVPVWMHNHGPAKHQEQAAATSGQPDSAEQIAADNDLMLSVDMALSASEESPLREYEVTKRSHQAPKAQLELRSQ